MRVPLSWLKEYVDINISVEELAQQLTMAGLEVASIEYSGRQPQSKATTPGPRHTWREEEEIKGGGAPLNWEAIHVGEIIEVKSHPNADRLVIAVVDYGQKEAESVTGAPNVKIGDKGNKVAIALAGATLIDPYSEEFRTFRVKPTKIRDVTSETVICSEKELGLSDDHTGVLTLDEDAPVGAPLADLLSDVVLELDLTPNLARCLSVIGVAREVAALTGQRLKLKEPKWKAEGEPIEGQVEVEIADPDLCSRYSASLIKGVKIGPSPFWMRRRLTLAGMRPINNIVDITNYVMLEWGQPLHAFDYDKLHGRGEIKGAKRTECAKRTKCIIVRRAKPGERMTTLDEVERDLSEDNLLITDEGGPIAIAGVMGGLESEVTEETGNILLESANFSYANNRRTAQALKIVSEASARFGRGIPAELTILALIRASELIRELAGGTIASGIADVYPVKQERRIIELEPAEIERILGMKVSIEQIMKVLESLECSCDQQEGLIKVKAPDHRLDLEIPADLIEEIARVIGYDQIPTTLMIDTLPPQRCNPDLEAEQQVRDILVGCGLTEVITYSLTNLESVARLDPARKELDGKDYLKLANPLSKEREYLRETLMPSLLETVTANLKHTERVAIFEIGRIYLPIKSTKCAELRPDEPRRLGIAMTGPQEDLSWLEKPRSMDFFNLKGAVETLLERLGLEGYEFVKADHPIFHPGRAAELVLRSRSVGVLGEVHPSVREGFELPLQPICLAELDLEGILHIGEVQYYKPISRFPAIVQDIAIVIDEGVPAQQVEKLIRKAGGKLLKRAALFDLYRGEQVSPGKKSLAYTLTYQAADRTLTDEEIDQIQQRIQARLEQELGAKLRS